MPCHPPALSHALRAISCGEGAFCVDAYFRGRLRNIMKGSEKAVDEAVSHNGPPAGRGEMQAPWANAMYRKSAACFTAGKSPALAEQPWRGRGRWPWPSAISAATANSRRVPAARSSSAAAPAPGAAASAFGKKRDRLRSRPRKKTILQAKRPVPDWNGSDR